MNKLKLVLALLLGSLCCLGQDINLGSKNNIGNGGNPSLPPVVPASAKQMTTALSLSGFDFEIVQSPYFTNIIVDPPYTIIVAQVAKSNYAISPFAPPQFSFTATFTLANNTSAPHYFVFPNQYWADNNIVFTIYDTNDVPVWTSVPLLEFSKSPSLLPYPLPQPVASILMPNCKFRKTVHVPLYLDFIQNGFLPDGTYRLEASLSGKPSFSANASFQVHNIIAFPIVIPNSADSFVR